VARHTFSTALRRGVFPHEGGYSNHPADPGGPTNYGITLAVARRHWKAGATAADLRAMPKSIAEDIYRRHYAAPLRYDDLPAGIDYCVLDYGINSGIGRAGKVLRRVLGLSDNTSTVTDGVIAAVTGRDPRPVINAICDERLRFLRSLRTWPVFGRGWERRVREVRELSLSLSGMAAQPEPPVLTNKPAPGKGEVPQPRAAQAGAGAAIATAGTVAAAQARESGAPEWIAVAIVAATIVIVAFAVLYMARRRRRKQEAKV
jgi:lysozyme family protein